MVPEHSFSSLNDTIRHALVTKTVNSEPIPITSNFILKLHKMHIFHLPLPLLLSGNARLHLDVQK